jgi:hypothetical protein
MNDANSELIEGYLEDLFQFALNIEEADIKPGKYYEGNPRNRKEQKT